MRVALISLLERLDGTDAGPIALRDVAGRSLARRQIDLALSLGCERIICLGEGMLEGVAALQHAAEKANARFHVVRGTRQIGALVTAADEVLLLADSLVAERDIVTQALGDRPAIFVLPEGPAIAAGFERVDGRHGWAGVALLRGSAVDRLNELPDDSDPVSALLRIGLQAGTRQVLLPDTVLSQGDFALVRREAQLAELQLRQLDSALGGVSWHAPGLALADRMLARVAGPALDRGIAALPVAGGGLALVALALGAGSYGSVAAGFGVLALAAFVLRAAEGLGRLTGLAPWLGTAWPWLADGAILGLVLADVRPEPVWPGAFPVLAMIGTIRLVARVVKRPTAWLLRDRVLLCAVLAVAAAAGQVALVLQLLVLLLLVAGLFSTRSSGIIRA